MPPNPQLAAIIPGFRPVFTSNDFLVQMAALEAGVGAMVIGRGLGARLRIAALVELDIDLGPIADSTMYLVGAKRMTDVPRVRVVVDAIVAELQPAPLVPWKGEGLQMPLRHLRPWQGATRANTRRI